MKTFFIIWIGQLVSLLGTGMTRFALILWAWQQTGEATTLALLGFFAYIPQVLIGPFAGIVVDRHDRRLVMMIADGCAGLMTIGLLLLFFTGHLRISHLYVIQTLTSVFEAFQRPAYSAATTMLVPKEQYARTSGMRSLAASTSTILAPILAGGLLALINIDGIMLIDVVTFVCAMGTLFFVRIPHPKAITQTVDAHTSSRLRKLSFGFRYIVKRKGLLGLLLIFSGMNLFATLTYLSILPAMILARTNSNSIALAVVQGALGIGGIVGGLIISIWGGPKRRIHACLLGAALSFLIGDLFLAVGRSLPVWTVAAFLASVLATFPIGYLLAGALADSFFEPAMAVGGPLSEVFGWLVGEGPGAGIALMFVCTSLLGMTMSLSGYLFRSVRDVEIDVPDHAVKVAV